MNHILLTTDENFAQHCGVCIVSLLKNNPQTEFEITVAVMGLSQQAREKLEQCVLNFPNGTLKLVDFDEKKLEPFPQIGAYRKNIYLRLWVDEFVAEDVERVLYLDVDTLVVDTIDELFNRDFDDFVIGAVDIPFADCHHRCHLPLEYGYFNSGVLLFNIPRWRKEHCRDDILNFLIENKEIATNPDQDALNGVLYQNRMTLDSTYNVITPYFRRSEYQQLGHDELVRIRHEAKIVHFNGLARPWFYSCNHPYQRKYFEYLALTPWRDFTPQDKSLYTLLKKHLRILLGKESFVQLSDVKGI
ncbi:glycosyltransferase family 8 protein [Vibrio tritonius]|uniref:Glycosyltransferase family 8 protein n=1 Tax=Vibrio tritonius TaxID=1435069 RepID=A0ABS7YSJ8_9VIBR|nr:glycosyltransferase family 8 protein [Vibrio tritonius]MCA2018012.1 glycosyltransferase family 8 protein [Vibrio tritonius]